MTARKLKPESLNPDDLLAWMRNSDVISATVDGISLTLKPESLNPDDLLAWMRNSDVISATVDGISLTLGPAPANTEAPGVQVTEAEAMALQRRADDIEREDEEIMQFAASEGWPSGWRPGMGYPPGYKRRGGE